MVARTIGRWWRAVSIEWKLPAAFTALLAGLVVFYVLAAYRSVRESTEQAVAERLNRVAAELARLAATSNETRRTTVTNITDAPALDAALAGDRGAPADTVLLRLRVGADSSATLLLDERQQVIRQVGHAPSATALAQLSRALNDALERRGTLTNSSFFAGEDRRAYYWQTMALTRDQRVRGYVAQLRRVGNATTSAAIEQLIGDASVLFANGDLSGPWIRLDGQLVEPPAALHSPERPHRHRRGEETLFVTTTKIAGAPWMVVAETPAAATHARSIAFLRRTGPVAAALIVLGALLAWLVGRRYTQPVRQLAAAADAIGAGHYDQRVPVERGDELGTLAEAFNAMAAQVRRSMQESETSRREAEFANRAKSEFLANMSHEIRTPINAMLGYADLMDLGIGGPMTPTQSQQLARIRLSGKHLIRLIDDLLDFARLETARLSMRHERTPARQAVDTALTVVEPQVRAKGVQLIVDCPADLEYVGDPDRTGQILVNLIGNAIKFTPSGGQVRVLADRVPGYTRFMVQDTGVGIEPERLETIFEAFVQAHTGYTRPHGGAGLGLTISKRLAEAMNGRIEVASTVGRGSTFTLLLPGTDRTAGEKPAEAGRGR